MGSNQVVEMNPLAQAEAELAQYFESAYGSVGFRAQNPNPDKFGGVWDEEAIDRLHRARLRRSHGRAVENARLVEMSLSLIDTPARLTIGLAFERRGYAYRTELGAVRLWQAFRREGSNVGLLGLVLEIPDIADRCVVAEARAAETAGAAFDPETHPEPSAESLLHFLEDTAIAAFDRWDSKRTPGTKAEENASDWMRWLPRWFTSSRHAADRRLVRALRAYEDVREQRLEWEDARSRAESRRESDRLQSRIDRLIAIAGGGHA